MANQMDKLDGKDFATLFGTTEDSVRDTAGEMIDSIDLRIRKLDGVERDRLILEILKKINSPEIKDAGSHRKEDWEAGWRENLEEFIRSGYDLRLLVPKYYKQSVPIRLLGEYVMPAQPDFVYQYTRIFRAWLFREYLEPCTHVYEFGCGTGHNLLHLAELYPVKPLYGFDWAKSSQEILTLAARRFRLNIQCGSFDFFAPSKDIRVEPGGGVFTFGALEQIGAQHERYLEFILQKKPRICIDVVGIQELYDPGSLFDYLALLYHTKRNYLFRYLTRLRELEASGAIEILKTHRQMFGNLFDDPYSYIVWRPL
jgi:SAM-dependent methyltransferase